MKISKMMKISVVLLIAVIAFGAIAPVSGGWPKKLKELHAYRVNGWNPDFSNYDSDKKAFVWYVSVDETFYIDHGWYNDDTTENIKQYPNHGWFYGHPYHMGIVVDGQEKQKRYSTGALHWEYGGEQGIYHLWAVYRIFEPGDLAVGDHEFNVFYSATDFFYDDIAGKWVKLKEPFTLNILDDMQNWGLPFEVDALIIRVVP